VAKVVLVGLEPAAEDNLRGTLAERHEVENCPPNASVREISRADVVFAGGEPDQYLSLLERVRKICPKLPFIVVTRLPETREWLDALEAGATDYCSPPVEKRHIQWMMESALPQHLAA
jgi:DNA-binding NtrC family response regulator